MALPSQVVPTPRSEHIREPTTKLLTAKHGMPWYTRCLLFMMPMLNSMQVEWTFLANKQAETEGKMDGLNERFLSSI